MNYLIACPTTLAPLAAGSTLGVWRARIRNTTTDELTVLESPTLPITWENPPAALYEIRLQRHTGENQPIGPVREQLFTLPMPSNELIEVVGGDITVTAA